MFEKVVIGINARCSARDAVKLAKELVAPGGTLTLAHVDVGHRLYAQRRLSEAPLDERRRADRVLDDVTSASDIRRVLRTRATSVGRGLHELVEREGADLLVMGSTRQALAGRVLMGDDTRDAINGAPCAVAIAPDSYADAPAVIREIGVAYDESAEAEHALAVGRELAATDGARLSLFEAVTLPLYATNGGGVPDVDGIATDLLASVSEHLGEIEGVVPHATLGDAAEELTLYSASLDLLVIGSRGFGPLGRLVHSSTSMQLARTARCPLLILTRQAQSSERVSSFTGSRAQTAALV